MQSSAVVTLRALVMLLCLVLVPLAAIFGSSLPTIIRSVVQGRGIPQPEATSKSNDPQHGYGEAPSFAPVQDQPQGAAVQVAGPARQGGAPPLWSTGGSPRAGAAEASHGPDHDPAPPATADPRGSPLSGGANEAPPARIANGAALPAARSDSFPQIERRLRELGATYYLLETWGNTGQLYRFHCKMAIAGNPSYTRPFEATEGEPLRAMARVLDQVEQWRSARQP
ncbi:MAG: hypothetical protein HYX69_01610 [Planctomycetia bacterium]|nr:hypothetical protein [Planctomycetia bacterium]